jgi:ATP-binding cassette subfamily B protein
VSPTESLAWPVSRAGEALRCLAEAAGVAHLGGPPSPELPDEPEASLGAGALSTVAARMGLELEPVRVTYRDADSLLRCGGPALLQTEEGVFALLTHRAGRVRLLTPDFRQRRVRRAELRRCVVEDAERRRGPEVERWLDAAGVPARRRPCARRTLLEARWGDTQVADAFLLRPEALAPARAQAREVRAFSRSIAILAAQAIEVCLMVLAWWLLGREALSGRLDRPLVAAFLLILFSALPFRLLGQWLLGRLSLDLSAKLKTWLLAGALATDPDAVRSRGVGQLFSQVVESETLEQLGLGGGLAGAMSAVQIAAAGALLVWARAWSVAGLLLVCLGLFFALSGGLFRRRRRSTQSRLSLTHGLVERLVGHRTRLAQEPRAGWHVGEDGPLADYLGAEQGADLAEALTLGLLPRAFLILAMAQLGRGLLGSAGQGLPELAAHLGLVLLAYRALRQLGSGIGQLVSARLAFEELRPLLSSRSRPNRGRAAARFHRASALLECRDAAYHYPGRARPALQGVDLRVHRRERILLTGPSGGGKSTLGAVLSGLRRPTSGLVLLGGLDAPTLGADGWRRAVAMAPQFHDNHLFGESLAFNLLMGRQWPPAPDDLTEAESLCRELGLGPLLERMPAGLQQIVGETGWQLSHGERSRVFMARALLQNAELLVLDESLGALDPQTMGRCLEAVERRAKAVVLIAHP